MSESDGSARPRQLTMAGWFVVVGSALLVVSVFDSLAGLYSVDTRESVSEVLDSSTWQGLGLSVADAQAGMRVALMIAAACAAAAVVLGVFVLQRHRGARIGLTVVAVPILLTSPVTGGLLGALIAACTVVLWTGPARDWFAGRPVRETVPLMRRRTEGEGQGRDAGGDRDRPNPFAAPPSPPPSSSDTAPSSETSSGEDATPPSAASLSTQGTSSQPAPTSGFGQVPGQQYPSAPQQGAPQQGAPQQGVPQQGTPQQQWPPPQWGPPGGAPTWPGEPRPMADARPAPVTLACLLTWGFAGVVSLLYLVVLLALVVAQDEMIDVVVATPEWEQANLDPDLLGPVLWVGCLMFLGWALGALVLAWFTWRRHNWARFTLAASAGVAVLVSLFAFPFGLLHAAACGVTVWALFSARAREWFARPGGQQGPPAPGSPGAAYGQQQWGPPQGPPQQGPPQQQGGQGGQGNPPVW